MEWDLISKLFTLSMLMGMSVFILVIVFFWFYDIIKGRSFRWKEELKEWCLAVPVGIALVIIIGVGLTIGWPVAAFFLIREELKSRGII